MASDSNFRFRSTKGKTTSKRYTADASSPKAAPVCISLLLSLSDFGSPKANPRKVPKRPYYYYYYYYYYY